MRGRVSLLITTRQFSRWANSSYEFLASCIKRTSAFALQTCRQLLSTTTLMPIAFASARLWLAHHLTCVLNDAHGRSEPDIFRPRRSHPPRHRAQAWRQATQRLASWRSPSTSAAPPSHGISRCLSRRSSSSGGSMPAGGSARCAATAFAEAERWINDARNFWERGFDRLEALLNAH